MSQSPAASSVAKGMSGSLEGKLPVNMESACDLNLPDGKSQVSAPNGVDKEVRKKNQVSEKQSQDEGHNAGSEKMEVVQNGSLEENGAVVSENSDQSALTKPIMMVALTAGGSLVHVPLVGNVNSTAPQVWTPTGTLVSSPERRDGSKYLSPQIGYPTFPDRKGDKDTNAGSVNRNQQGTFKSETQRFPHPVNCKNQISLLKSLRAKKNSLVREIEARGKDGWMGKRMVERKNSSGPISRRNSSGPTGSFSLLTKTLPTSSKSLSQINGRASNYSFQGKKFAGYKSMYEQEEEEENCRKLKQDLRRQSSCSPVSDISDFSAPCSPAVSCHSDSVLFQKRKSDPSFHYDSSELRVGKKKKSDENLSTSYDDDGKMDVGMIENDRVASPVTTMDANTGECDILKSLYNALNMPLPEASVLGSSLKSSHNHDVENMPDVEGLANFIQDDSAKSLDDFLAQL